MTAEPKVEEILHVVLADPDVAAQWAAGRLVKAPDVVQGFTGLEPLPSASTPWKAPAARPAEPAVKRGRTPSPDMQERAGRARRERVGAARAELAEAETERLEAGLAAARETADTAAAALAAADEGVREARARLETARAASAEAAARSREAAGAAAEAQARQQKAARNVEKVTSPDG
ncbi:hypothetical protein [Streptomyces sp. NPDC012746]|uniref:hypothetical protein n=1 Tax=Streptomyces sp. NPDC012746 TaxID=3364845 RepID=UPI00369FB827